MTATATIQRDGWTRLEFSYHPDIVDTLKTRIPASRRRWVPESKWWLVAPDYCGVGIQAVRRVCPDLRVIHERLIWSDWDEEAPSKPSPIRPNDPHYAALHLLPSAPPELVSAAYRCLAKLNHPDLGGSTAKMETLNTAHRALKAKGAAA